MIQFPITDLLDQNQCFRFLLQTLHPDGLRCPRGHPLPDDQAPHDRKRAPLVTYRSRRCGAVFNLFVGTLWSGTQYDCATVVMVLRGFAQGTPNARDDDGDGFCEVHCNTMAGIWAGLGTDWRAFRGVHKKYLAQYMIVFEWAHNVKRVNGVFLRALMIAAYTYDPT